MSVHIKMSVYFKYINVYKLGPTKSYRSNTNCIHKMQYYSGYKIAGLSRT